MPRDKITERILLATDCGIIRLDTRRRHYFILQVVELFHLLPLFFLWYQHHHHHHHHHHHQNKQCCRRVRPTWYAPPASNPDLWPFDPETDVQVTSKMGNLPSKFGHARPLGSWVIRYVCDGRTDIWMDRQKQSLLSHSPWSGHNKFKMVTNKS